MTDNELVVRRFYELFMPATSRAAARMYARECEWEFPAFGAVCRSRREVLDVCQGWRTAFPDGRVEVVNLVVSGDVVVAEWDSHGTWSGPLSDEAGEPNGRRFQRRGCAVAEIRGGEIVRCRDYFDRANMYAPLDLTHLITG